MDIDIVNKTTILVAKRNSGKTNLLNYLVHKNKPQFSKIFCVSGTEKVNHFYEKSGLVDKNCILESWDDGWATNLLKKMAEVNENKPSKEKKSVLLILDDCMSSHDFTGDRVSAFKQIFAYGRHSNISIIINLQYLNTLPPVCRNNCDTILCGQVNHQSVNMLAEEYLSGNLEKKDFFKLYNRATKDYNFLVINMNSIKDSDDLNQIYGIIKVPSDFVK